eukprot:gb/GECG01004048.1/.p1 GENE.gb/GECG01004048.1/~~gb/GECG01004048.1/.p1  ORF type:complete len:285 (+),score=23.60 gb/GECG01004048.1/:1-855(+)
MAQCRPQTTVVGAPMQQHYSEPPQAYPVYQQGQPHDSEVYVVYGIPLRSEHAATLTRKVMNISIAMSVLSFFAWAIMIAGANTTVLDEEHRDEEDDSGGVNVPLVFGIAAVCIPLCGYTGAKNARSNLLTCFWVWNLLCVAYFSIVVILNLLVLASGALNDTGTALTVFFLLFGIAAVVLQVFGVVYGKRLAEDEYWSRISAAGIPTATAVQTVPQTTQSVSGYPSYGYSYGYPQQPPVGYPTDPSVSWSGQASSGASLNPPAPAYDPEVQVPSKQYRGNSNQY